MSEHLSDLALDRLLAGELDGTAAAEGAQAHLASCGACAARHAGIVAGAAAFPQQVWIAGEAAKVRKQVATQKPRSASPLARAVTFAAAASLVAVAIFFRPPEEDATTTLKGRGVSLALYARRVDGRVEKLEKGAALAAGESVRFEVSTDRGGSLSVLGVDGAGKVSVYSRIELPHAVSREILEGSVVLDDAPIAEHFFAVLCENGSPDVEPAAKTALEHAGGDPRRVAALGSGCREAAFLVRKTGR